MCLCCIFSCGQFCIFLCFCVSMFCFCFLGGQLSVFLYFYCFLLLQASFLSGTHSESMPFLLHDVYIISTLYTVCVLFAVLWLCTVHSAVLLPVHLWCGESQDNAHTLWERSVVHRYGCAITSTSLMWRKPRQCSRHLRKVSSTQIWLCYYQYIFDVEKANTMLTPSEKGQ